MRTQTLEELEGMGRFSPTRSRDRPLKKPAKNAAREQAEPDRPDTGMIRPDRPPRRQPMYESRREP